MDDNPNRILKELHEMVELKVQRLYETIIDGFIDVGMTQEEILDQLNTTNLEEELYNTFTKIKAEEHRDVWTGLSICDYDNYECFVRNLDPNNTVSVRLKALDDLLGIQIIETNSDSWQLLSKLLQQSLLSTNDEIFSKTLRLYHRIISFGSTASEGYLSLLKASSIVFANRYFLNTQQIDFNNKMQKRIIQVFKILLKMQSFVLLNSSQGKQKVVDDIIASFISFISRVNGEGLILSPLDFLCVLDCNAVWFRNFCFSLQTRNVTLATLNKNSVLVSTILSAFTQENEMVVCDNKRKGIVLKNTIDYLKFVHSTYFLRELFSHRQDIFPFKTFTLNKLLLLSIANLQDEVKKPFLLSFIKDTLKKNSLAFNQEVLLKLFEPFNVRTNDKKLLFKAVEANQCVFDVIIDFCEVNHKSNFLFSCTKNRRQRRVFVGSSRERWFNVTSFITNLACNYMRYYVNHCESQPLVDASILKLLKCCSKLYESCHVNLSKLMSCLKDFYKALNNYEANNQYTPKISVEMKFFIENSSEWEILEDYEFISEICNDIFATSEICKHSLFVLSISNTKAGVEALKNNYNRLIKNQLEKLWHEEDNCGDFFHQFLNFVSALSCSYKPLETFLLYENEGTVVEGACNEKSSILAELIENSVTGLNGDSVGLIIIKILITNADLAVFLESNFKLSENLNNLLQNRSVLCSDGDVSSAAIVDGEAVLIQNLSLSLKYFGNVNGRLNENLLKQTKLMIIAMENSPAIKRYKVQNELQKFLQDFKGGLHDHGWLLQARRAFKATSHENYKVTILSDLIEQVPKSVIYKTSNLMWPPHDSVSYKLFPEDFVGICTIIRFGVHYGFLHSSSQNEENLTFLLKQSRTFLNYTPEEFEGFDWFVGIVFLICTGSFDRCRSFLCCAANLQIVPILWRTCGRQFLQPVVMTFFKNVVIILDEIGPINAALMEIGLSAEYLAKKWFNQCFFNILTFSEVCNFVSICCLFPPEFVVFYTVALFEHCKEKIFACASESDLQNILNIVQIEDFRLCDYWNLIESLSKQYKHLLKL